MVYACVKDKIIRNVIEANEEFISMYAEQGGYDCYVLLKKGFGIGDKYLESEQTFVKVDNGDSEIDELKQKIATQEQAIAELRSIIDSLVK